MIKFLALLTALGLGYLGYNYYINNKEEVHARASALVNKAESMTGVQPGESPPTESAPSAPGAPVLPAFKSRIDTGQQPAAGEPDKAPPGVYYVTERVSVVTGSGIKALSIGEQVKLMQRLPGGKMKVTIETPEYGAADFEVKQSQVTNDLNVAREAERADFVARGGQL